MFRYSHLDCNWSRSGEGQWTCLHCDIPFSTKILRYSPPPPRNCRAKLVKKSPIFCHHLGPSLGTEQCQSCQGTVRIKVFACAVHGKCTLAKKLDGIACCAGCGDYQPSKRDPDPDSGVAG